jgi:hypothetical protein
MREDLQSSISYASGKQLTDLRRVNYVILGGENAGEHLLMRRVALVGRETRRRVLRRGGRVGRHGLDSIRSGTLGHKKLMLQRSR